MMSVIKFVALVYKYRRDRILKPDKAEEMGKQIDKACAEYIAAGFIEKKDIQ